MLGLRRIKNYCDTAVIRCDEVHADVMIRGLIEEEREGKILLRRYVGIVDKKIVHASCQQIPVEIIST